MKRDLNDIELQTLLNLDGLIFWLSPKYWVKIQAKLVEPTDNIPHGIKYSLTLHDRNNTRILGFDNAHSVKIRSRKKYGGRIVRWDHRHNQNKIELYRFQSPLQLLEDFWKAVDEIVL